MTMKKKLAVSGIAGAMGLSLIAGGTWAAFNDVEATTSSVEAGTLKMDLSEIDGEPYTFNISNLKPGDHMTRQIQFNNSGSLAIKDVLMTMENVEFRDYVPDQNDPGFGDTWAEDADTNVLDYLDQFEVKVMKIGLEGDENNVYPKDILKNVSLKDLYLASDSLGQTEGTTSEINTARQNVASGVLDNSRFVDNRLKVTTTENQGWEGIPLDPTDEDQMEIEIKFVDSDGTYDDGTYLQNQYQGDEADIKLSFEARQWDGQEYDGDGPIDENRRTDTNRDGSQTN